MDRRRLGRGALMRTSVAATMVGKSHWRGELLDGAALAAQQLGRSDVPKRLEAAWRAAPTLIRLLRWLAADGPTPTVLRAKAKKALTRCPRTAGRQLGLLRVLTGDLRAAADCSRKLQDWAGRVRIIPVTCCFRRSLSCLRTGHRGG